MIVGEKPSNQPRSHSSLNKLEVSQQLSGTATQHDRTASMATQQDRMSSQHDRTVDGVGGGISREQELHTAR
jgi:hypothetical protein